MKSFGGKALFLDRNDINTDEIIPAKYLTEITKAALKPYLLEDLKLEGFDPHKNLKGVNVIITRENFGCGSSREHAPWALEVNDINVVIAVNYARIFRQNMYNCGMLAINLEKNIIEDIFKLFSNKDTDVTIDVKKSEITFKSGSNEKKYTFTLDGFDRALVESEGWVGYANKNY